MATPRLKDWLRDTKKLKGRWRLTPEHEIAYEGEGLREELSFKGPIVALEPGRLVVAVTEKQSDKTTVTRLVKISGDWKVNAKNQIIFEMAKESGRSDEIVLKSGWRLNDRYEIVYSYRQTTLKRRKKIERELVFSGHWELSEKNHITFLMGGDSSSRLRFRGAFQTPSILAKKGEVRYQIGLEAAGHRSVQTLTFFGKWKVSRLFGLSFELETGPKRARVWMFGGTWNLTATGQIEVHLRSSQGEPLGLEVVLSRDFLKGGEVFARLQKFPEESRLEAGARWTA